MSVYPDRIEQLDRKVSRKAELCGQLAEMSARKEALEKEVFSLRINAHNEQADVDNLEGFSVKNLLMNLTGKKKEIFAKETREAKEAKSQYDNALFQMEQLTRLYTLAQEEFDSLRGCEMEYWNVLLTAYATGEDRRFILNALTDRLQVMVAQLEETAILIRETAEKAQNVLENLRNLRDGNASLNGTARDLTLRGYLLGGQGKLNRFREIITEICASLSVHPVSDELTALASGIFDLEENTLSDPMITKMEIEQRLLDAIAAVKRARERLLKMGPLLDTVIEERRCELSRYRDELRVLY